VHTRSLVTDASCDWKDPAAQMGDIGRHGVCPTFALYVPLGQAEHTRSVDAVGTSDSCLPGGHCVAGIQKTLWPVAFLKVLGGHVAQTRSLVAVTLVIIS
jgi:hypothetical protein